MIDDAGTEDRIPIVQVSKPVMIKVVEFCEHMKEHTPPVIEKPLSSSDMSQIVDQWHADFVNVEDELLFEMVMAANYLDIKPLLELCCAKVASKIKNKSV